MSDPQWLKDARAEGRIVSETHSSVIVSEQPPAVELIHPTFRPSLTNPVWEIPLETRSEINLRDWRKRSKRSDAAWRAVSRAFGPHLWHLARFAADYHAGGEVRVKFTRLGGRALDKGNLPTALKGVEDAVAFFLGADDGSPLWKAEWDQEPGGAMGVRIQFKGGNV